MQARAAGRARPTSIRPRSASRSPIPATKPVRRDFEEAQIRAVIALCRDIIERHAISADRVLAHSDIAPMRKQGSGRKLPLAAAA
jgi:N-acetyl-anhydromuramyl-L-alanine amidase AmpD